MGFTKKYFQIDHSAPADLQAKTERRVRFEEVDALGIVWHGRYASYFEDGRIAFGDKFGLDYLSMKQAKIAAPVVQFHVDYFAPLLFDQNIDIEAVLHWSESLRLNFSYRILRQQIVVAAGYTVQLLTDFAGNLLFVPPDLVKNFRENWQIGEWSCKG